MLKGLAITAAVIVGMMILVHTVLSNGVFLKYLDENPDPRWVPTTEYSIGQGYYLFQDLQSAATYFIRVSERYPKSSLAEDSYFSYVQCLEDANTLRRNELIDEYQKYLDRYPDGEHARMIHDRMDALRMGPH